MKAMNANQRNARQHITQMQACKLLEAAKVAVERLEPILDSWDTYCGSPSCPSCGKDATAVNDIKAAIADIEGRDD